MCMLFSLHSLEIPKREKDTYVHALSIFVTCLLAIERVKQRRTQRTFRLLAEVVRSEERRVGKEC